VRSPNAPLNGLLGEQALQNFNKINVFVLVYQSQGKYTEAEPLYNQALDIFKRALGPDHPYVAIVCENIEKCLKELGKEDEAVVYEEC